MCFVVAMRLLCALNSVYIQLDWPALPAIPEMEPNETNPPPDAASAPGAESSAASISATALKLTSITGSQCCARRV